MPRSVHDRTLHSIPKPCIPFHTLHIDHLGDALSKHFDFYSRPHRIISDRGTCFMSLEFNTFCQERDIQHIKVATGAQRANGQVERGAMVANAREISKTFSQSDWYKLLNKVEYAINNARHSSTQVAPSVFLFGV